MKAEKVIKIEEVCKIISNAGMNCINSNEDTPNSADVAKAEKTLESMFGSWREGD